MGEQQEYTVISTALQQSGIYRAGALYYFILRYDFLFSAIQKEREAANASDRNLILFCKHTWNHKAETLKGVLTELGAHYSLSSLAARN